MKLPWCAKRHAGGSVNRPSPARLKSVCSAPSTPPATSASSTTVPNITKAERISGDVQRSCPSTQAS